MKGVRSEGTVFDYILEGWALLPVNPWNDGMLES